MGKTGILWIPKESRRMETKCGNEDAVSCGCCANSSGQTESFSNFFRNAFPRQCKWYTSFSIQELSAIHIQSLNVDCTSSDGKNILWVRGGGRIFVPMQLSYNNKVWNMRHWANKFKRSSVIVQCTMIIILKTKCTGHKAHACKWVTLSETTIGGFYAYVNDVWG